MQEKFKKSLLLLLLLLLLLSCYRRTLPYLGRESLVIQIKQVLLHGRLQGEGVDLLKGCRPAVEAFLLEPHVAAEGTDIG